jgi:predicted lactoylglutathione lyase
MAMMLFVNLPVAQLDRATMFYGGLGFSVNPQFTDDTAACIVLDDGHLYLMLLTHGAWARFTSKALVDSATGSEVILTISVADRASVDTLVDTALAAGGSASAEPQDFGFMYTRSFQDPDGHLWEVTHLDTAHLDTALSAPG